MAGLGTRPDSSEPERLLRSPGTTGSRGSHGVASHLSGSRLPSGWRIRERSNELASSEEHLTGCVPHAWTSRFRRSLNPVRFRAAGPSTCRWVPGRLSSEARSSTWPRPTLCVPALGSQRCPPVVFFGAQQTGRHGERACHTSVRQMRVATVNVPGLLRCIRDGSSG